MNANVEPTYDATWRAARSPHIKSQPLEQVVAKSLLSILSQIERLQKEAASIQSEVVTRIRKDIEKYGLTAEQLFGAAGASKAGRAGKAAAKSKTTANKAKAPKYADGTGNTWGGMGKRPDWLRQALAAGKSLEDFLITAGKPKAASATGQAKPARTSKRQAAPSGRVTPRKTTAVKRAVRRRAAGPKPAAGE